MGTEGRLEGWVLRAGSPGELWASLARSCSAQKARIILGKERLGRWHSMDETKDIRTVMLRATCRDLQMDLPISVSEQSLWWMGGTRRRWGVMDLRGTSWLSTQHDGYLLNADIQGQQHEAAAVNAVRKLVQTPWQPLKQQNKRKGNRKKMKIKCFFAKSTVQTSCT